MEFILKEGSWLGSTVKINGSAFKRPDITRVRYISSGSDFIHGQIKEGGGPGWNGTNQISGDLNGWWGRTGNMVTNGTTGS